MPMLAALQAMIARIETEMEQPLPDDEREWLSQIETLDDLTSYTPDGTGRWEALAASAAKALGATQWDQGSVAGDH